jgi:hypothetical protein
MQKAGDPRPQKALSAKRESKHIEFIDRFDPKQPKDWCEIVKETVAMANSGGGTIVIGVKNDGSPSLEDISAFLKLDPAHITDQIAKYTGEQFDKFTITEFDKAGYKIALLLIEGVSVPLVFTHPGTYAVTPQKQENAFVKGTVYFRHGAKSEPGSSNDLRGLLEKEIDRVKKSWLTNIRKIIYAPTGHQVKVLPPEVAESNLPSAHPIRITDDLSAPAYRPVWDETPYQSPQEILVGALKSWKRDKSSYASESDMCALYAARESLHLDEEKAECLLESAINRHMPFFFFAQLLSTQRLVKFIKRIAISGKHPAPNMVARLAHAIGGNLGIELLEYIENNSRYPSVKSVTKSLKQTISRRNRIESRWGYYIHIGAQSIPIEGLKASDLETLMADAIKTLDKAAIKHLDTLLYAPRLEAKEEKGS